MPPRRSPRSFPLPRNPHRAGHPLRGFWQFMYHLDGVTLRAVLQNARQQRLFNRAAELAYLVLLALRYWNLEFGRGDRHLTLAARGLYPLGARPQQPLAHRGAAAHPGAHTPALPTCPCSGSGSCCLPSPPPLPWPPCWQG
jgi:hypothetical protein